MIPIATRAIEPHTWQQQLSDAVTDPAELLHLLELEPHWLAPAERAAKLFALRVPRGFIARMQRGNPHDPLLRQVLPLAEEHISTEGFSTDPLAEAASNPSAGVIHKYHGRVLLIAAGACAINCRYCFRRHFPYADNRLSQNDWQAALDYITARPDIHEVILSGGDPLVNSDARLDLLISALEAIPHVHTLRIHSRLAIVLPARITSSLCARLSRSRLRCVLVSHANHPQEIDASVALAFEALRRAGVTLLNQSVLLRGINDDAEILIELNLRLFNHGVLPYYLFQLDKVQGAAHFLVSDQDAAALMRTLQRRLPGYLVPRLSREQAGQPSKTWLTF
ncbi:EF-P beta-lysylation protein EpmB [Atopomonas sediminilitoris]|uniref:EF-P beta-lysylation protein EpmB n=1 Tax=Atopomonas sediminilitoris TaxID=2919919 RepID=UPI001F4DEF16|nr:EF-P beta-lysylation protein EpmB [Atopomonas sediminilitoris]MCJ8170264.1 EF-P beta-lysylation protein EpmB [Atopomonas sediminilitoris]